MQKVIVVAPADDGHFALELDGFDLHRVHGLVKESDLAEADCVAVAAAEPRRVAATAATVEVVRRDNALAFVLIGDSSPALDAQLLEHDFDAFVDPAWPAPLLGACLRLAIRRAQLGRNVVDIQRTVLQYTRDQTASLYALASHDDLTGLYNRRYFLDELEREHERCVRQSRPYALVFIDLDDLKLLNSVHGHLGGSIALRELGRMVTKLLRTSDIGGRLGGDEFAVLLGDCDRAGGLRFAERLRQQVADHAFLLGPTTSHLTVSIGVAAFPEDAGSGLGVVDRADAAMYRAKASGKNATAVAAS